MSMIDLIRAAIAGMLAYIRRIDFWGCSFGMTSFAVAAWQLWTTPSQPIGRQMMVPFAVVAALWLWPMASGLAIDIGDARDDLLSRRECARLDALYARQTQGGEAPEEQAPIPAPVATPAQPGMQEPMGGWDAPPA